MALLACPVWAGKEGGVRFGLLGGFTSSSTNVEKMDLSSVSLYHAGVALHVPVGPTFAVQFQLQYQVKGATLDKMDTSPASLQSLETKVGYLELPVQLQLRIPLPVVRAVGIRPGPGRRCGYLEDPGQCKVFLELRVPLCR